MGSKLRDQVISTPTKPVLSLNSFPLSHKPVAPESPWALTPPLQPMVSIPFEWEEAPGRPRPTIISSPCKPRSARCLELPPRMLVEAEVTRMPPSPTTVLDGPRSVRSLSHRFCFEGPIPNTSPDLGLYIEVEENNMMDQVKFKNEGKRLNRPWKRWASGNNTKWNQELSKNNFDTWNDGISGNNVNYDTDIEVKIRRFRKRSKGSLYKLSNTSSRVFENIIEYFKQIMVPRR